MGNSSNDCSLAYFVVFIILFFFVFILSGCYIKQKKSEKFYTPRLNTLVEPIEPYINKESKQETFMQPL